MHEVIIATNPDPDMYTQQEAPAARWELQVASSVCGQRFFPAAVLSIRVSFGQRSQRKQNHTCITVVQMYAVQT